MTSGQQDRPDDESEENQQQSGEGEQSQGDEGQQGNYVPGSAADPKMGGVSPGMGSGAHYGSVSSPEERNWSMLLHLSALSGLLIPFANLIGPLVVWLLFRGKSDMVDYHGKRALNFQISMTIYALATIVLWLIVIGFFLTIAIGILSAVYAIVAAVRANRGDPPGYILSISFLK